LASRFRFRGSAIGVAGQICKPFSDIVEAQAASALTQTGGFGSAQSAAFKYRDILHFDLAHTEVSGAQCDNPDDHDAPLSSARITSTVEGLNIMGVITADRVVATLSSTFSSKPDYEPSVRLLGTRFENLKVAGILVQADLAVDVLDRFDTHRALAHAWKSDNDVQLLFGQTTVSPSDWPGNTSVSSVRSLPGLPEKCPGLVRHPRVIHVVGFGTVRLAEVTVSRGSRNVAMIHVELDCPYKGRVMCCEITGPADEYVTSPPDDY
jgi:hypothetical protein